MKRFDLGNGKLLRELYYSSYPNTEEEWDEVTAVWKTIENETINNPENIPFKNCLYILDTTMTMSEIDRLAQTYETHFMDDKTYVWTSDALMLDTTALHYSKQCVPITAAYFGDHDELFVVLRPVNGDKIFTAPATMLKEVVITTVEMTCAHCGIVRKMRITDDSTSPSKYCTSCARPSVRRVYDYNENPHFKCHTSETELIGVELELERRNGGSTATIFDLLPDPLVLEWVKRDGSLKNGVEIVTHPLRLEEVQETGLFKTMSNGSLKEFFRTGEGCGMHVHIDRRAFDSGAHEYRFAVFINEQKNLSSYMSRRGASPIQRWAAVCSKDYVKGLQAGIHTNKYTAVNFRHENTLEVRIFKATLSPYHFMANIEYVLAVKDFTKSEVEGCFTDFYKFVMGSVKYPYLTRVFQKTRSPKVLPLINKAKTDLSKEVCSESK